MSNPILTAMSHRTLPHNYEYNSKELKYKNPLTTIFTLLALLRLRVGFLYVDSRGS